MAEYQVGGFKKYRGIMFSVLLFIVLDLSVLIMNFYISFQISEDALGVNLGGRQRMLSQRTVKAMLQIDAGVNVSKSVDELKLVRDLFDGTLHGFDVGAYVTDASGNQSFLKGVTSPMARQSVNDAKVLWEPYVKKIDAVVITKGLAPLALKEAREYALANNLTMLKHMNDLTVDLENVSNQKASTLRMVQTIGIIFAFINFLYIMFHSIRQLRRADEQVQEARRETTRIMKTVNEGLFLVDKNLVIGSQYSDHLEQLLGTREIADKKLLDLLSSILDSREDVENTATFVEQLYAPHVIEELINDLNPLNKVRVVVSDLNGHKRERWLSFGFTRVVEDKQIISVLVSVQDITQEVELALQLEQERNQNEYQMALLNTVLNTESSLMQSFIDNVDRGIVKINEVLKDPGKTTSQLQQKLQQIYREMHSLKGEASALDLSALVGIATKFEQGVKELQQTPDVSGNDFLPLTMLLNDLMTQFEGVKKMVNLISGGVAAAGQRAPDSHAMEHYFVRYGEEMGKRNGKQVHIDCRGLDEGSVSESLMGTVKEIIIQMMRNAIVHGIEEESVRRERHKDICGRINVALRKNGDGSSLLEIEDDGNGINIADIRRKVVEKGLMSEDQADRADARQLVNYIFTSGFSTAKKVTEDAGRGVGMDVIIDRVQSMGGKINVSSAPGSFTRFRVTLPQY